MLEEPLALHCIGGFVICYFYGLPHPTGDIDYYSAIPANLNLIELAGEGSSLAKKHKVWLHHVAVTNLPENYETRLTEMATGMFKQLHLYVPDPYDSSFRSWSETVRKIETMQSTSSIQTTSVPRPSARGIKKNYDRT